MNSTFVIITQLSPSSSAIFGETRELNVVQSLVKPVSLPATRLVVTVVLITGAVVARYGAGVRFGGDGPKSVAVAGVAALAGAAAGRAVYYAAKTVVQEIAAAELRNHVVTEGLEGVMDRGFRGRILKRLATSELELKVVRIVNFRKDLDDCLVMFIRYGVSKQDEAFNAELSDIYLRQCRVS